MTRNTLFASLIAFGAVSGAAQASEGYPRLVNVNGSQETIYDQADPRNEDSGAYAAFTGGSNPAYFADANPAAQDRAAAVAQLRPTDRGASIATAQTAPRGAAGLRLQPSHGG